MRTMRLPRLAVLLALGALSGCVLFTTPHDRAVRRSPAYKDGYGDGCAAASVQSTNFREGPYRDEALYKSDPVYRAGWANGYQTCKPAQSSPGQPPATTPIPQPVPGH